MGTGEENTPSKTKPVPSTQEIPSAPSYPDWSGSLQAYYAPGATPPPFFTSTVASPTPHPYLWGGQSLIPPYGAPVPYPALYPPGGVYGHPNMQPTHMAMLPNIELEGKGQDGKDRSSAKKSKANSGNAGMAGAKAGESGKATSGSGNDGASQSAESGSDGSSDASDDNQQDMSANRKGSFDRMLADASVPGKPVGSMPATNLNIGMDLWNASGASAGSSKLRPNPSATSSSAAAGALGDQWIQQDEREIKRQKRKQSNRESARRSRLRKQAECEELQGRVENLNTENRTLREELLKLSEECEKLNSENTSIKEELTRVCGPEVVANLDLRVQDVDSKS